MAKKTATERRQAAGMPEPAPRQVWTDCDKRTLDGEGNPREVVVLSLSEDGGDAVCTVLPERARRVKIKTERLMTESMVAVHNDYRMSGKLHTFWLMTKGEYVLKGEGHTDVEALEQIVDRLVVRAGGRAGETASALAKARGERS